MTPTIANPFDNMNADWVSPVAQIMDIFPVFGTVKNVIDLFLRYCWKPENLENLSPIERAYHTHLHEKTLLETILYLVPGLAIVVKLIVTLPKINFSNTDDNTRTDAQLNRLQRELIEIQEANARRQEETERLDRELREEAIRADKEREEYRRLLDEEHQTNMKRIEENRRRVEEFQQRVHDVEEGMRRKAAFNAR